MTDSPQRPAAIAASEVPPRTKQSNYPEPFFSMMQGREKRPLGDFFGIKSFGVNLTRLIPGAVSSIFHRHTAQDELIYVLEGEPTLITDEGETALRPGMCAGLRANGTAHQLVNRSGADVVYLEIGDRAPGDEGVYPRDDLKAVMEADGKWSFAHKDGTLY